MSETGCTICLHPRRRDIERAAVETSERKAAKAFDVSRDALHRHIARNHTSTTKAPTPLDLLTGKRKATAPAPSVLEAVAKEAAANKAATPPKAEPAKPEPAPPPPPSERQPVEAAPPPPAELGSEEPPAPAAPHGNPLDDLRNYWVNILADTIALGRFNGRETISAIAAKAGVEHVVVQAWAREAARRVEASWGNADQRWQISLAEWRRQLQAAKDANDLKAAGIAQAGIDKAMANMPKRPEMPVDDETAVLHRTTEARRRYLIDLFRQGRFYGLQTAGHLALAWDDLGALEFSELVTSAAAELNFRRGSDQARRVVLVGILEKCVRMALAQEDPKTAARLAEIWAKIDQLTAEQDLQSAALKHEAMRLIAGALQRHPAALADVHATLAAADAQKRAALAPVTVTTEPDAAE